MSAPRYPMRAAGPEASGEATRPECDDSNMSTALTSGPEATSSQGEDSVLREKATHIALLMVDQAFDGRPAHQIERHLTRTELQAFLILAFEYGSEWESRR